MLVAVFSDIHGNKQALDAILNDIKKRNVNEVICIGDVIGLGPSSNDCLKMILENNIKYIMGNHELYYTKGIDKHYIIEKEILDHNDWVRKNITYKIDDHLLNYELNYNNKRILFCHYFLKNNDD